MAANGMQGGRVRSSEGRAPGNGLRSAAGGQPLPLRCWSAVVRLLAGSPSDQAHALAPSDRELPDVTGILVLLLVTLGLFVVPVGATLMQGPAILAGLLSGG